MILRFPLRPDPVDRETVPSFLSRFAAMRRNLMVEFAQNMGVSLRRFLDGDSEALASLVKWGGLSVSELVTLQSWSGEPVGDVRMLFRGEVFVSRALRNPTVRGCPVCLREDSAAHSGDPAQSMAIRGDWQLRDVTLCLRHHHLLVPLWHADNRYERYDFAQHFRRIETDLQSGKFDLPLCTPNEFDLWLDHCLATGQDGTWLANHSLYASTSFCRLLGMEILRLRDAPEQNEVMVLRAAQEAGFAAARQGEGTISAAFMALADASGGRREEPKAVFGNLFSKLQYDFRNDPAFEPFRRLLRACILTGWPVAAGETVLGELQTERRLHSLYSAAREIGVTVELLEPFLIEAGALTAHDTKFANRRVFSAADHAELLAEIPTLVSIRALKREIGASRTELERLIAEGTPLAVRRFDGAAGGRRGWGVGTFGRINSEIAGAGSSVRTRARYLANNNPWLSQAVANWAGALIGAGIVPTPKHVRALDRAFDALPGGEDPAQDETDDGGWDEVLK